MKIQNAPPFIAEGPQPLVRTIPPGEAYPVTALGPLRMVVEAVQGMTQAPMAIPAQSALAVASLAVQGFANVETIGGTSPLSLYCLTMARSGERKTSCDALLMAPLRDFEREAHKAHGKEHQRWENDYALWKGDRDKILLDAKKGKGEKKTAAKADLQGLGAAPSAPLLPDRTVTEPTFEGLTNVLRVGQPSMGIFSDEGGQFLGGFAMNGDNRQKTLAALNDAWQGNPIRRTRVGDGSFVLYGRRLAINLMVQPSVALAFMADAQTTDTGFLPRFLICDPPSTIGTRLHAQSKQNEQAMAAHRDRLTLILETPMVMDADTNALLPLLISLSPEARAHLIAFSDTIESAQAKGGDLAHITGYASKSAEQAARIAGVMTLWVDLQAPNVSGEVMCDAIVLAQYYLSEASRLANAANISKAIDEAETLKCWLLKTWEHAEVTVRDVVQLGPNNLRESPRARAALKLLKDHGWLHVLPPGTVVMGSPRKEAWKIVRAAHVV